MNTCSIIFLSHTDMHTQSLSHIFCTHSTHTRAEFQTHTLFFSRSHPIKKICFYHIYALCYSCTLTLTISNIYTHLNTHSLSQTHTLPPSLPQTQSLFHTYKHFLTQTLLPMYIYSFLLAHAISLFCTLHISEFLHFSRTNIWSLFHTCIFTHMCILSLTRKYTCSISHTQIHAFSFTNMHCP